jgi:two-component system, LytTR family, sensor kinase
VQIFTPQAFLWTTWALLLPTILFVNRRIDRVRSLIGRIGAHTLTGAIASLANSAVVFALRIVVTPLARQRTPLSFYARGYFLFNMLIYAALVGGTLAMEHRRRAQRHELAAAHLTAQLSQAQLRALRMQLHPHFLFNALNTVSMLVRTGHGSSAVRMIAGLSDLLRQVLDDDAHEVPLRDELAFLDQYLQIEQARFHDRLQVTMTVASVALDAHVPRLILQPLVENAIHHGISQRVASGRLSISAPR